MNKTLSMQLYTNSQLLIENKLKLIKRNSIVTFDIWITYLYFHMKHTHPYVKSPIYVFLLQITLDVLRTELNLAVIFHS